MKGIVLELKDISDSREVMESKEPPRIRWFIYIMTVAVICAVVLLCCFEIDEYSKVSGELRTADASSSVISSSSCKLKEIKVSEGQHVSSGDVLFILDVEYAKEQKGILEDKLSDYKNDLSNTELLKNSIEDNTNYFKNDPTDSKYYYRYEQYQNGVLLTAQEIGNSQLNNNLSEAENENNLEHTQESINRKNADLTEYRILLDCVYNDSSYNGSNELVYASFYEYNTNYQKAKMLCNEYKTAYDTLLETYNNSLSETPVTSFEVENAKSEYDIAYSTMVSYQSAYLSDIRSQLLLIENQLIADSENEVLIAALNEYSILKTAVETGVDFNTTNSELQTSYDNYISNYNAYFDDCSNKETVYQDLYTKYAEQSNNMVKEDDVDQAYISYESAQLDVDSIRNTYIYQVQSTITKLEEEIETLEGNRESLEIALNGSENLEEYEKLSGEKLKNEAIVTINSEIDSLEENISSIESQLIEVNETIRNSEITASFDGIVTLVDELNVGDIVQAGNSLCSLVPDSNELKVMLYIPENEISKLKIGQTTEYTFDAIPYNEYGRITGEILSISADSIVDETSGAKFYIAQANLSELSLENNDGEVREVKTGMLVEARVISGSKKAIIWLLEKINFLD